MKILLDCLGGDKAPEEAIKGIAYALGKDKDIEIAAIGPDKTIKEGLEKLGADASRVSYIEATEAVLNTDHPSLFLKQKPNSSLAKAYEELRGKDEYGALVSAGPTGAILTGAILRLGRLKGVSRPCLMATLPTRTGKLVRLLDAGANMDCKPEYLLQFALMADTYLRCIGIENPRIGLLNVGMEEGKGNELTKAAHELIKGAGLNFVGNIEGDHVLKGEADVIVCDGFAGNVFIKSTEEACYYISDMFKEAIFKNALTKFGALFQIKGLKAVKKPFEFARKACAPLLGTKKLVLKCHGKANAETFGETLLEAKRLLDGNILAKIGDKIANSLQTAAK